MTAATAGSRAVRIGLTGPIGCGKSTVAGWLAERGAVVIDADDVARAVTAPGEAAHDAVLARFGDAVRGPDGALDRAALARIVFADPASLAELERLVHPAVRERILAELVTADAAGAPAVVVEAIKLVEGGLAALCDEVWLVTCDSAAQRARLAARAMAAADMEARIAAQGDLAAGLAALVDRVLATDGGVDDARARAVAAYEAAVAAPPPSARSDQANGPVSS